MATELERLTAYVARQCLLTPGSYSAVVANGIRHEDFPEHFLAKKVLQEFSTNLEKGFQYAVWQSNKLGHISQLEEIYGNTSYPSDALAIKTEYTKLLEKERAEQLGVMLCNNPANGREIVDQYLKNQASSVEVVDLASAVVRLHQTHAKMREDGRQRVIIPNWPHLSESVGGFNGGRLGVVIATTGFGKSNLGIQLSLDASTKETALYVNMEMTEEDFTQRYVASMEKMMSRDFTRDWDVSRAELHAKTRKLFFTTGKSLSRTEIYSVARYYKQKHDLKFLFIDYDQKIKLDNSRVEEWKQLQIVAEELEAVAKELGIYVMLFSQANSEGGISGSRRISFHAAHVLNFEQDEDSGKVVLRASKNRFGKRNATIDVKYDAAMAVVREDSEEYIWSPAQKKKFKS